MCHQCHRSWAGGTSGKCCQGTSTLLRAFGTLCGHKLHCCFPTKKKHYKSVSPVDPWQHTIIIYCIFFVCKGHNFRNIKGQFHRILQHVVIGQISHQLDFTITRKQINFILILTGKLSLFSTSIFSFISIKNTFFTELKCGHKFLSVSTTK